MCTNKVLRAGGLDVDGPVCTNADATIYIL